MAKPRFAVQHFIACPAVEAAFAGPGNPYTLRDVSYTFDVSGNHEWPVRLDGLWVFVRFVNVGRVRRVGIRVEWLDDPAGPSEVCEFPPWAVRPPANEPVLDRAWRVDAVRFPGLGRYAFEMLDARRRPLAREFIRLRRTP
jgi:hypothetical protein